MINIQGADYKFIQVTSRTGYQGGSPVIIADIDMNYDFKQKWDLMVSMLQEWEEQKRLINSNPAVKASYEQFQQMIALAKEVS
jgi:hypothetical protein